MGDNTGIEWAGLGLPRRATHNPLRAFHKETGKRGWMCVRYNEACTNCYAATMNRNLYYGNGLDYTVQGLGQSEFRLANLDQPLRWKYPRGVFWCSMTDWMAGFVPVEWKDQMLAVAVRADHHRHAFLTKRAELMAEYFRDPKWRKRVLDASLKFILRHATDNGIRSVAVEGEMPRHVWLGVTVHDQASADKYLPNMYSVRQSLGPSAVLWVSYEPALGPVDWSDWEGVINWLVCGGESGTNARPMHPDWARQARDWCLDNDVAFYFKQWGEFSCGPIIQDESFVGGAYIQARGMHSIAGNVRLDDNYGAVKVGKKRAGRVLDGMEWNEFPQV